MNILQTTGLCLLLALSIITSIWYFTQVIAIEHLVMPSSLRVDDVLGVTTDTSALHFGKVPTDSTSERLLLISNPYPYSVAYAIGFEGPLSQWVTFNISKGIISPHNNITFAAKASVPRNASKGNVTGFLTLTLYQKRYIKLLHKV